jgi:hypothetical protein
VPVTVTAAPVADRTIIVLDVAGMDAAKDARRVPRGSGVRVLAINLPTRERDVVACAEAGVACCLTVDAGIVNGAVRSTRAALAGLSTPRWGARWESRSCSKRFEHEPGGEGLAANRKPPRTATRDEQYQLEH